MEGRLYLLDWVRVVMIFYAIFVWHIDDYAEDIYRNTVTIVLANIALHPFVFISSYLLSIKSNINSLHDIISFIKKRFIRIYPLYLLALIMCLLISWVSFSKFFAGVLLLNMILNIDILTLWFISMILIYYLLLSIILYRYSLIKTILFSFIFCLFCYILHKKFGLISPKLVIYYPSFLIGIIFAKHLHIDFTWGKSSIIATLSYATYCMYLFHRVIYWVLLEIYTPNNNVMTVMYLTFAGIPLIFLISLGLQRGYDRIQPIMFRVE